MRPCTASCAIRLSTPTRDPKSAFFVGPRIGELRVFEDQFVRQALEKREEILTLALTERETGHEHTLIRTTCAATRVVIDHGLPEQELWVPNQNGTY